MPGGTWTGSDAVEHRQLASASGVWLLPGPPYRDDDGAYAAFAHCLDTGTPFLGTCGGFQYACVELARRGGVAGAAPAESAPGGGLVVAPLAWSPYGGGGEGRPGPGTPLAASCGEEPLTGFYFCGPR